MTQKRKTITSELFVSKSKIFDNSSDEHFFVNQNGNVSNAVSGGTGDMLSGLSSSEVPVSSATTLSTTAFGKMHVIQDSGTPADYTITLPSASGHSGKFIGFRIDPSATKLFTLDGNGSETIDGDANKVFWSSEYVILQCTGTGWVIANVRYRSMLAQATRTGTAVSVPNTSVTDVDVDNSVIDVGNLFSAADGGFVIRRGGIYQINGFCGIQGITSGAPLVISGMNKNASEIVSSRGETGSTAGSELGVACASGPINLSSGDIITLWVYHEDGGFRNTRTSAAVVPMLSITEIIS